jgi:hypothetical protein
MRTLAPEAIRTCDVPPGESNIRGAVSIAVACRLRRHMPSCLSRRGRGHISRCLLQVLTRSHKQVRDLAVQPE